jgi:hypothetical protein
MLISEILFAICCNGCFNPMYEKMNFIKLILLTILKRIWSWAATVNENDAPASG